MPREYDEMYAEDDGDYEAISPVASDKDNESSVSLKDIDINDPDLLDAQIGQESSWNSKAVSKKGARGLGQILPSTFKHWKRGNERIDVPEDNLRVRARYLAYLKKRYNNDTEMALIAYHEGEDNVDRYIEATGSEDGADIQSYLEANRASHEEGAGYLPAIKKRYAAIKREKGESLYGSGDEGGSGGVEQQAQTEEQEAPLPPSSEEPGSRQEATYYIRDLIKDPNFVGAPIEKKLAALDAIHRFRPAWDEDAEQLFKDNASVFWEGWGDKATFNAASLVGRAPYISEKDAENKEAILNTWKEEAPSVLEEQGFPPYLLGDQLDKYIEQEADAESRAHDARSRGIVGSVFNWGINAAATLASGGARVITDVTSGAARFSPAGLVFPETTKAMADFQASIPQKIKEAPEMLGVGTRDFLYEVDPVTQRPKIGPDGNYITSTQATVLEGIGQLGTYLIGAKVAAARYGAVKVFGGLLGYNALQSMEGAYQETRAEGGSHEQGITAGLANIAPGTAASVLDMLVINASNPYMKGLGYITKLRLGGIYAAKQMAFGAVGNLAQQAGQSAAVGEILGKSVQSWGKLGPAAAIGAAGGALGAGWDIVKGGSPDPVLIDPTWNAAKIAATINEKLPNQPIEIYTAKPEEYRAVLANPLLKDREVKLVPWYDPKLNPEAKKLNGQMIAQRARAINRLIEFKKSHAKDIVLSVEEAELIEPDLLKAFDFNKTQDGKTIVINKNESYVGVAPKELPDILKAIDNLHKDLSDSPTEADVATLISQKEAYTAYRDHLAKIYGVKLQDQAVFSTAQTLKGRVDRSYRVLQAATSRISKSKDPAAKQSYRRGRIAAKQQYDNAKAAYDAYTARFAEKLAGPAAELFAVTEKLRTVNQKLKKLPSDTYLNDLQAKQRSLNDLLRRKNEVERKQEEEIRKLQTLKTGIEKKAVSTRKAALEGIEASDRELLEGVSGLNLKDGYHIMFSDDRWHAFDPSDNVIASEPFYKDALKAIPERMRQAEADAAEMAKLKAAAEKADTESAKVRAEIIDSSLEEKAKQFTDADPVKDKITVKVAAGKKSKRRKVTTDEAVATELAASGISEAATSKLDGGFTSTKAPYDPTLTISGTGSYYSKSLSTEMRNLLNYLVDGLGEYNVLFITHDDLMQEGLLKYFDSSMAKELTSLRDKVAAKDTLGVTKHLVFKGGQAYHVVSLRDGNLNMGSALVASHELGHAYMHDAWAGADIKVKQALIDDFNDKQELIQGQPRITYKDADLIMSGAMAKHFIPDSDTPLMSSPDEAIARVVTGRARRMKASESDRVSNAQLKDIAFKEYLANRFAQWATSGKSKHLKDAKRLLRGTGRTAKGTENFLKTVGYKLYDLWKSVKAVFGEIPEYTRWMEEGFDREAAYTAFYAEEPSASKFEGKVRERAISRNIIAGDFLAAAKIFTDSPAFYTQEGHPGLERESQALIDKHGRGVALGIYNAEEIQFTGAKAMLGAMIVKSYEKDVRAALGKGDASDAARLTAEQHDFMDKFGKEATQAGQYISALKALAFLSKGGLTKYYTKKMLSNRGTSQMIRPDAFKKVEKIISSTIDEYYKDFSEAPEGVIREYMQAAMFKDMERKTAEESGVSLSLSQLGWYLWYGNILSGGSTQVANLSFTGIDLFARTMLRGLVSHPKDTLQMIKALPRAFKFASIESRAALSGKPVGALRGTKMAEVVAQDPKWRVMQHQVDRLLTSHPTLKKLVGTDGEALMRMSAKGMDLPMRGYIALLTRYPFRTMNAVDAFMGRTAQEMMASSVTSRLVREEIARNKKFKRSGITQEDYAAEVGRLLNNSEQAWVVAREQAAREWALVEHTPTKGDKKRSWNSIDLRALELIEKQRPEEVRNASQNYARERTYIAEPQGSAKYLSDIISAVTNTLSYASGKKPTIPFARMISPFNRVTVNILSSYLDYTPIGVVRGWRGEHITHLLSPKYRQKLDFDADGNLVEVTKPVIDSKTGKQAIDKDTGKPITEPVMERIKDFTKEQSREKMAVGTFSTIAATALGMLAAEYLDDDDPEIAFYGKGPRNERDRQNWKAQGHIPYSMYIKSLGLHIKMAEYPSGPILGVLGTMHDAVRWKKDYDESSTIEKVRLMATSTAQVFMEMGVLRSLNEFLEVATGERNAVSPMTRAIKGALPLQGVWRDIAAFNDATAVDQKDWKSSAVYGIPYLQTKIGKPALNFFADPLPKLPRFYKEISKDPVLAFLRKNNLTIAGVPGRITIGIGDSQSEKARFAYYLKHREQVLGRLAYNIFTPQEAFEHLKISGPRIKDRVKKLMTSNVRNKELLQKRIDDIVSEERARAKLEILQRSDAAIKAGKEID